MHQAGEKGRDSPEGHVAALFPQESHTPQRPAAKVESQGHGTGRLCLQGWTRGFCISCSQPGKEHLLCAFSEAKEPFGPTSTYKSSLPTTSGTQQCQMEGGTFSKHLRDLISLRESKSTPGSSGMKSTHSSPARPTHHPQVSKVSNFKFRAAQRAPLSHHGTKHQHKALLSIQIEHKWGPE